MARTFQPLTVAEIIAQYLADVELRFSSGEFSKQLVWKYRDYLTRFAARFGHQLLDDCRKQDLVTFIAEHPNWVSNHTRTGALRAVVTCFRWAEEVDLTPYCPYRKPRHLRLPLRPRRPMTNAEYVAIMRAAMDCGKPLTTGKNGNQLRAINETWGHIKRLPGGKALRRALFFLKRTGCRTCEMRAVRWDDIDWEGGIVRLQDHKTAKSTGKDRIIGLEPVVLRFLRNLYRQRDKVRTGIDARYTGQRGSSRDFVFNNSRDNPWAPDAFEALFRKFANRAGVSRDVQAYGLRHNFTVNAIEAGIGVRQIADALGHAVTRYVDWYGQQTRYRTGHIRNVAAQAVQRQRRKASV